MKTLLFFLVIGFSLCTAGKAQTSLVSTREKFRHHEISVSYGFLPITDANSIAEEFIAPTASFGIYTREKTSYYGALNISYIYLKSATKLFSVLLASKRPLITELADKLRLKYPLLPTISPCPTMRLEAIRSIIPISCRRYPKSV